MDGVPFVSKLPNQLMCVFYSGVQQTELAPVTTMPVIAANAFTATNAIHGDEFHCDDFHADDFWTATNLRCSDNF